MIKEGNIRIAITLPKALNDTLEKACHEAQCTKSSFIIALIHEFIYRANMIIEAKSKKGD